MQRIFAHAQFCAAPRVALIVSLARGDSGVALLLCLFPLFLLSFPLFVLFGASFPLVPRFVLSHFEFFSFSVIRYQ